MMIIDRDGRRMMGMDRFGDDDCADSAVLNCFDRLFGDGLLLGLFVWECLVSVGRGVFNTYLQISSVLQ